MTQNLKTELKDIKCVDISNDHTMVAIGHSSQLITIFNLQSKKFIKTLSISEDQYEWIAAMAILEKSSYIAALQERNTLDSSTTSGFARSLKSSAIVMITDFLQARSSVPCPFSSTRSLA